MSFKPVIFPCNEFPPVSGITGPTGLGLTGPTGPGVTGPTGLGLTGPTGPGVTGPTGLGLTGPTGPAGNVGLFSSEFFTAPGVASTSINYSEITNYKWNQPYSTVTLATAPTGTVKYLALANDGNGPVLVNPGIGKFLLQSPNLVNTALISTNQQWNNLNDNITWFVNNQQGDKLVGSPSFGILREQGKCVRMSAAGDTVVIASPYDGYDVNTDGYTGAAFVFIRDQSNNWIQQAKLVDATFRQAEYVSISGDGNTIAVSVPSVGALIYTRTGSSWTQSQLINTFVGNTGPIIVTSLALSTDSKTLAIGSSFDASNIGAVWIFVEVGGFWSQQGSKLVANDYSGAPGQGTSVALSSDGNTLVVGGPNNSSNMGAFWIYTRDLSALTWSQFGNAQTVSGTVLFGYSIDVSALADVIVIGSDSSATQNVYTWLKNTTAWSYTNAPLQQIGDTGGNSDRFFGSSLSLSKDGNTLAVGAYNRQFGVGGVFIFTRYNSQWNQQGGVLLGSTTTGPAQQGFSVSLSSNGNLMALGGFSDDNSIGATWIFA